MAGSLNKVTLLGSLGKDPEIANMSNGNKVAKLSVATSESWTDKASGEKKEMTNWHNVVVFSQGLVEVASKYLKKGSKVYLEGQLQTRDYEKDGVKRYVTEVVLQNFGSTLILLDAKTDGQKTTQSQSSTPAQQDDFLGDDVPF